MRTTFVIVFPFIFDHELKKTFVCTDSPTDVLQAEGNYSSRQIPQMNLMLSDTCTSFTY